MASRRPRLNDESLLYQTLIGTWPLEELDAAGNAAFRERIEAYMIKAAREAKLRTSWANVNTEYEDALTQFVRATLELREGNLFLSDLVSRATPTDAFWAVERLVASAVQIDRAWRA